MLGLTHRKPQQVEVGSGEFRCPNCRVKTRFRHFELVQRKSVLFIFVFKGETLESYIECERCGRRMPVEDLRGQMPSDTKEILAALEKTMQAGASIEQTMESLVKAGMPASEARAMVNATAGILLKKCPSCELRYVSCVSTCRKCGRSLPSR